MIPNVKLTSAGAALLAKTPAGSQAPVTRWQIGKGALTAGSSLDRTALVDPVEYLELYDVQNQGTEALILGQFTNQGMESGFPFEEVGLLAQDPDAGEILMCYGNAFGAGEEIQPEAVQLREFIFGTQLKFSGEANMSGTIEQGLVFIPLSQRGQQNGVASLDSSGKVPEEQLPDSARLSNLEEKSTLADGDALLMQDSAAESATKRVLWSTVKALLAQVFVPLTRKINNKALTADVALTGADIAVSGSDPTAISNALANRFLHLTSGDISPYSAILDVCNNRCPVDSSFFAVQGSAIINAADSPFAGFEVQYFVLADQQSIRKTVLAFNYSNLGGPAAVRTIYNGAWRGQWERMYTSRDIIPVSNGGTGQNSLEGLVSLLMGQGMCKIATGAYTGNGTEPTEVGQSNSQTIALPFAPKAVLVIKRDGEMSDSSGHVFMYGGLAVTGHNAYFPYGTKNYPIVQISGNGFVVYNTLVSSGSWGYFIRANLSPNVYNYIAFG